MPTKLLILFCLCVQMLYSQKDSLKKVSVFPIPLLYYTPETRLSFGAGVNFTFKVKPNLQTNPSQVLGGFAYTQNKQLLLYSQFNIFSAENKFFIKGEVGYYRFNYFFWGIGNRANQEELFFVDFPRVQLFTMKKMSERIYLGPAFLFENYKVKGLEPKGQLSTGTIPGGEGNYFVGFGAQGVYDSRNVIFFPSKGMFIEAQAYQTPNLGTGSQQFFRSSLSISNYRPFLKSGVFATQFFAGTAQGAVPFQQLQFIGGNKRTRGYYEGRYRDNNVVSAQVELRKMFWSSVGGVAFLGIGALGNNSPVIDVSQTFISYGAGLRFCIDKINKLNLRIDYAFGNDEQFFYFTVGEAF